MDFLIEFIEDYEGLHYFLHIDDYMERNFWQGERYKVKEIVSTNYEGLVDLVLKNGDVITSVPLNSFTGIWA